MWKWINYAIPWFLWSTRFYRIFVKLGGTQIHVRLCLIQIYNQMQNRSRSRSSSNDRNGNQDSPAEPSKRLFISGVTPNTTADDLRQLFEACGSVNDLMLKPLDNGGMLCFVEMSSQSEADAAISALNGKRVGGKMMWVKYARPRPQKEGRREGGGGRQGDRGFNRGGSREKNEGGRMFGGNGQQGDNNRRREGGNRDGDRNFNRGGFRGRNEERGGFAEREEETGGKRFGNNNWKQGGDSNRGERDQGAFKSLAAMEEHDY